MHDPLSHNIRYHCGSYFFKSFQFPFDIIYEPDTDF